MLQIHPSALRGGLITKEAGYARIGVASSFFAGWTRPVYLGGVQRSRVVWDGEQGLNIMLPGAMTARPCNRAEAPKNQPVGIYGWLIG